MGLEITFRIRHHLDFPVAEAGEDPGVRDFAGQETGQVAAEIPPAGMPRLGGRRGPVRQDPAPHRQQASGAHAVIRVDAEAAVQAELAPEEMAGLIEDVLYEEDGTEPGMGWSIHRR